MEEIKLNTIDEAIEQLKRGEFVIVVDDEDRENEGDFIMAAEKISAGRGDLFSSVLICFQAVRLP